MSLLLRMLLLLGVASLAVAADPMAPTIQASSATPGVDGSVTFAATVTANGALTSVVFEYRRTSAYGRSTDAVSVSAQGAAVPVSAVVTDLDGRQTYHFRVVAKNEAGQAVTDDATFVFAPVLTIQPASGLIADHATLHATLAANGRPGTAFFQYSTSAAFDSAAAEVKMAGSWTLTGTENSRSLSAAVEGLARNQTFFFRLVFLPTDGTDLFSTSANFLTNQRPVANADTFHLRSLRPTRLDVLKNDTDGDGDRRLVSATSSAAKGLVMRIADGLSIEYQPGAAFRGTDTFTYTITDSLPGSTAAAAVTIRSFGLLLAGQHGGLLLDANGEALGYFRITTTETGAFTGSVLVNGVKESFTGSLGPDGTFRGSIEIDGRTVPLALRATENGGATTLDADFDDGRWTAALRTTEASRGLREELAGRYTVEFPSGTATSDPGNDGSSPAGTGWAALKLGEDGVARIKGRLPDGRSFSTRGVLGAATTGAAGVVTFYDDPRRTRVSGTLTIGTAVSGTLQVARDSGGGGLFSTGYGLQSTASGARYVQPDDGKRAIEGVADASGRQLTFTVTGGDPGETFTRELRVGENDEVTVVDRDSEGLKVKIDRDSGRFTAWFTGSTDDQRIKGTGVFIQGTSGTALGRGTGVFTGENGTGKITITAGGSTTPVRPDPGTTLLTP